VTVSSSSIGSGGASGELQPCSANVATSGITRTARDAQRRIGDIIGMLAFQSFFPHCVRIPPRANEAQGGPVFIHFNSYFDAGRGGIRPSRRTSQYPYVPTGAAPSPPGPPNV
jgi:hypothetical protein